MRDYWMRDPRNELARYMEDCFLNELARTGEIKDLGITLADVVEGARVYQGTGSNLDRAVAENAFVCDLISKEIEKMNWSNEK